MSLLSEVDSCLSFPYELYSRILSDVNLIHGNEDYSGFTRRLFEEIATDGGDVGKAANLLCLSMINGHTGMYDCSDMKNFIDRFPSVLERGGNAPQSQRSLLSLLRCLLECQSEVVATRIETVLSRICANILKVAGNNKCNSSYPLEVLYCILSSRLHSVVRQQHSAIARLCVSSLARHDLLLSASKTLAALYSHEKPEAWVASWRHHIDELQRLLTLLGLTSDRNAGEEDKASICRIATVPWGDTSEGGDIDAKKFKGQKDKKKVGGGKSSSSRGSIGDSGGEKILAVAGHFRAHCTVLSSMLQFGCSSGFVCLPTEECIYVMSRVASLGAERATNGVGGSSRMSIPNAKGFSAMHFSIVSVDFKNSIAMVLSNILRGGGSSLIVQCKDILRCLSVIICSDDALASKSLMETLLECVTVVTVRFPSLVNTVGEAIVGRIGTLLEKSVHWATQVPTAKAVVPVEAHHSMAVLKCCESLLMHGGPYLSDSFRDLIEFSVGRALLCCCKGVQLHPLTRGQNMTLSLSGVPYTDKDTRLHRAACEHIRIDAAFRDRIVLLAAADILVARRSGALSSNLVLLKRACTAYLKLPGVISEHVVRAAALVGIIMHPVSLPVPSINLTHLMRSNITERLDSAFDCSSAITQSCEGEPREEAQTNAPQPSANQELEACSSTASNSTMERKRRLQEHDEEECAPCTRRTMVQEALLCKKEMLKEGAHDNDDEIPDIKF